MNKLDDSVSRNVTCNSSETRTKLIQYRCNAWVDILIRKMNKENIYAASSLINYVEGINFPYIFVVEVALIFIINWKYRKTISVLNERQKRVPTQENIMPINRK